MAHRKPNLLTLLFLIVLGIGVSFKVSRFFAKADAPPPAKVVIELPAVPRPQTHVPELSEEAQRNARRTLIGKEKARTSDEWKQRDTEERLLKMGRALEWWRRRADNAERLAEADLDWVSDDYYRLPFEDLEAMIQPPRGRAVKLIREDGWGHGFEFLLEIGDRVDPQSLVIRSPGRDGLFEALDLKAGDFPRSHVDRDIVWQGGYIVVRPSARLDDR